MKWTDKDEIVLNDLKLKISKLESKRDKAKSHMRALDDIINLFYNDKIESVSVESIPMMVFTNRPGIYQRRITLVTVTE